MRGVFRLALVAGLATCGRPLNEVGPTPPGDQSNVSPDTRANDDQLAPLGDWSGHVHLDPDLAWHAAGRREIDARIRACHATPTSSLEEGEWVARQTADGIEVARERTPRPWPNGTTQVAAWRRGVLAPEGVLQAVDLGSGFLVAIDAGEFGGGVWWMDAAGGISEVCCVKERATRPLVMAESIVVGVSSGGGSRLVWVTLPDAAAPPSVVRSVGIPEAEIAGIANLRDAEFLLLDLDGTLRRYSDNGNLSTIGLQVAEARPEYVPTDECQRDAATRTPLNFYGVETTPDGRFAVLSSNWGVLIAETSPSDHWRASWQLPVP